MVLADRCVMPEAMRALAAPRFGALSAPFMQPVIARPLPNPQLLYLNTGLAQDLGLDRSWGDSPAALPLLAGNAPWPGQTAFASAYAGHQFGAWVPRLGDGRVLTLAEWQAPDGGPVELQLKGAGPTPYARGSDGRATLRSSIRELLACEALHALGVPTTRALALVGSSLAVMRDEPEAAAVLSRTAPCFVRFGHFEFHARHGSPQQLAALADHVIEHHFPYLVQQPQRHAAWLAEVIELTAALFAHWQTLGFCHGVLNTDNLSVLGLTLDYGPYGFMERFRPHHVCNASDHEGRYAYTAQPTIGRWNCARLLEACLGLLDKQPEMAREQAAALLLYYDEIYRSEVMRRWRAKLGLREVRAGDAGLLNRWLTLLQRGKADFTLAFRNLAGAIQIDPAETLILLPPGQDAALGDWLNDWRARLASEGAVPTERAAAMRRVNPRYVLRNHLAQAAIEDAQRGSSTKLQRLLAVLARPFDEQKGAEHYAAPQREGTELEVGCSA
ncbi:protein adenylyltransferase SelO [Rhodoferax ferrireducens]|uniref:protein adenylyltransferase SelO n=1 Tax=Rhodoferax ferrireducens TaxID=192843 RepID=UPI001E4FA0F4|nr:YdiU family protein [Rhodoferax ferrireducens]